MAYSHIFHNIHYAMYCSSFSRSLAPRETRQFLSPPTGPNTLRQTNPEPAIQSFPGPGMRQGNQMPETAARAKPLPIEILQRVSSRPRPSGRMFGSLAPHRCSINASPATFGPSCRISHRTSLRSSRSNHSRRAIRSTGPITRFVEISQPNAIRFGC